MLVDLSRNDLGRISCPGSVVVNKLMQVEKFSHIMTTATGVCISGNIGFVGLVVPHMMRMLVGPDHRRLLPASVLAGGAFLVLCDTMGRVIFPPTEIRVGIMTAALGTPYFLYLLRKNKELNR